MAERPLPLQRIIASTTLAVANTTTTFAPADPRSQKGVAAGAGYWQPQAAAARFWVNVSAISGTSASLTVTVSEYNPLLDHLGDTIIASAALIATGPVMLDVYPSATAIANHVVNGVMSNYRITAAISNTTTPSATFTVDVEYIPV